MKLINVAKRKQYKMFASGILISILIIIYFTTKTIYNMYSYKEINSYKDRNSNLEKEINLINTDLKKLNVPLEKMSLYKWFNKDMFKIDLQNKFNKYIMDNGKNKHGFNPFLIRVDNIDISEKYFNLISIKLTYIEVDWIFGFEDGFKAANELLLSILKEEDFFSKNDIILLDYQKEEEPSLIIYLKLLPKK